MKLVKHLCIVVVLLSVSLSCFARKIDIKGEWSHTHKSIHLDIPIEASIDESSKQLYLQFQENLGLVYVTVTNCSGEVVYHEAVETKDVPSLIIQLDDRAKEECVLSVTDGRSEVCGEFIINNQ